MLYIHDLGKFNIKTAEIESVYLIRELKTLTPHPFSEEKVTEYLKPLLISEKDIKEMIEAFDEIEHVILCIEKIQKLRDEDYEPINLQRAINMLNEIPKPLMNSIKYSQELLEWQKEFIEKIKDLLNSIPKLVSIEEKKLVNEEFNNIFKKILRNEEFRFNFSDVINEAELKRITNLNESLANGFLFHVTLEEEINKVPFAIRKHHIALEKLNKNEEISNRVVKIKKGVETAYQVNMKMINLALVLFSYIKWLQTIK
ncbi:MAG: hypothetical protein QXG00_03740 [Candidatus Woesearchaeota archaeon]